MTDLPLPDVPEDDADDADMDLSGFEIVADVWPPDNQSSDEEPEAGDVQPDNSWVDRNVDDVVNRNVNTASTDADDAPTGGPLDNDVIIVNAPAELHENEQGGARFCFRRYHCVLYQ